MDFASAKGDRQVNTQPLRRRSPRPALNSSGSSCLGGSPAFRESGIRDIIPDRGRARSCVTLAPAQPGDSWPASDLQTLYATVVVGFALGYHVRGPASFSVASWESLEAGPMTSGAIPDSSRFSSIRGAVRFRSSCWVRAGRAPSRAGAHAMILLGVSHRG